MLYNAALISAIQQSESDISSVQLLSHVRLFVSPWTSVYQASYPSPTPRVHPNPCHPTISSLSSPSPPALNLSQLQGLFKWVSSLNQVAKYWSFSFNISPSNEHPGLISFWMDWLALLAVQGTLKSLLQHLSLLCIHIYPLFFGFPSHLAHHRALSRLPRAIL